MPALPGRRACGLAAAARGQASHESVTGGAMQVRRKLIGAVGAAVAAIAMTVTLSSAAQADTGFSRILARNSAKCLDVRAQDNFFSPGARIQQWDCSGAAEQQWSFHPYATVPMPGNPGIS